MTTMACSDADGVTIMAIARMDVTNSEPRKRHLHDREKSMHLFQAMMDCHHRLMEASDALRHELAGERLTPKLLTLRLNLAVATRENLAATQELWTRIERNIPDIRHRIQGYDHLKAVENDLHVRYARHIAAWPARAIAVDFNAFAKEKTRFLDDLRRHIQSLERDLFGPARRLLEGPAYARAAAAFGEKPTQQDKKIVHSTAAMPPVGIKQMTASQRAHHAGGSTVLAIARGEKTLTKLAPRHGVRPHPVV